MAGSEVRRVARGAGTRASLVLALLVAALAGAAVLGSSATAADFKIPKQIGAYKVLGGKLKQDVDYLANYRLDSQDRCWVYKFSDDGDAHFDLTFNKGDRYATRYRQGAVEFLGGLPASGKVSRHWVSTITSERGTNDDSDCPGPSPPTDSGAGCGVKTVNDAGTFLGFVPTKNGRFAKGGKDATLFGAILRRDRFNPCPSDSVYGTAAIGGTSKNGIQELVDARVGQTVKLAGEANASGPGPDGFFTPFDWTTGAQNATIEWSLTLKRVKKL